MEKLKARPFYTGAELAEKINEIIEELEDIEKKLDEAEKRRNENGNSI